MDIVHTDRLLTPQRGELGQTDRLDVDVSLSVEASSVPQLDGVDLTQGHRVSQHRPVHCYVCLKPEALLCSQVLSPQYHFHLCALIQGRNLQLQQDVMSTKR